MSDPDSPLTHHDPVPDPDPSSSPPLPLLPPPPPDVSSEQQQQPPSVTDLSISSSSAVVAAVPPPSSKSSRRLPPPCWSLEETIALIDGYKEKWHALNRGNLKANHWEEVAEAVASHCPDVTPKKTAVQCRHKMEKLRKRYRTEIQRARSVPVARFISSWVHFKRMEAMENRPEVKQGGGGEEEEEEEDGGDGNYAPRYHVGAGARTTPRFFNRNGTAGSSGGGGSSSSGGIRIRIPTGVSIAQPGPRFPGKIDQKYTTAPSLRGRVSEGGGKRGRDMMMMQPKAMTKTEDGDDGDEDDDPVAEIANAIRMLGETLLRTEQSKMEMTREIETMRMEMEMKRTKMILESQQRIVEAFAKSLSENKEEKEMMKKKARRSSSSLATTTTTDS